MFLVELVHAHLAVNAWIDSYFAVAPENWFAVLWHGAPVTINKKII